jgi:hypothetical protein
MVTVPYFDKNSKPQKFFYRDLNIDIKEATKTLEFEYSRILNGEMYGVSKFDFAHPENEMFKESESISTIKSREYNAFQMYYPFMHELYSSVVDMTREACRYYDIDYNSNQFVCQAWFNINNKNNGGKLNWHDHVTPDKKILGFHGYYSVSAEPSETHYQINDEIKINNNINNRALLSLVGFPHAMSDWDFDGPRITIAYDVLPIEMLLQKDFLSSNMKKHEGFWEQHYFPLPKFYD